MILAETDSWLTASVMRDIVALLSLIVSGYVGIRMATIAAAQAALAAAQKASEVKSDAREKKLDVVAADVRKVELATNSMKDQLVARAEAEGLARGGTQERARADLVAKDVRESDAKQEIAIKSMEIRKDIAKVPEKVVEKIEEKEEKDRDL